MISSEDVTRTYPAARLNIRDVNVAVVFMPGSFESAGAAEREREYRAVQRAVAADDAAAHVVLVWEDACGQTRFIAPIQQHPFFQLLSFSQLYAQVDRTLSCA
jgi:hypothetical protein